tara:strand:- start:4147 stop:4833 length:687 start_codon:yes stop_codon:yes gene_type:complete
MPNQIITNQEKRYERKFQFDLGQENAISVFLRCENFKEIYKKREITSLYYDDYNYTNFIESEDGISKRSKIRARYYNEGKEGFNLEYKIKEDNLNWKRFETGESIQKNQLLPVRESTLGSRIKICLPTIIKNVYSPKVLIRYLRKYFVSKDNSFRVTIDYKIRFSSAISSDKFIDIGVPRENLYNVLELKYGNSISIDKVFIKKLSNNFNLNLSRYSKYCEAIKNISY